MTDTPKVPVTLSALLFLPDGVKLPDLALGDVHLPTLAMASDLMVGGIGEDLVGETKTAVIHKQLHR